MLGGYFWRRIFSSLFITIVCFSQASTGAPDDASPAASPTCALIDFDHSPLAAVVEAKLLGEVDAKWLERNAIDEVVKEQELQALFRPEGGAVRAALGKLLKADLLILVRDAPPPPPDKSAQASSQQEKPVPAIDLAVTETRRGLRLLSRSIPRSDDAEADADALVQFVREALGKHAQQVTEVYAVPPFVSRDLGYEHDYLRGAYARLLEQMLLERPGALVVELAEAQSLAKEVALADASSRLKREVPFYLLGEYRNGGTGDKRHLRLSLKLMRGEQQIAERTLADVAPGKSATALRDLGGQLVAEASGVKQTAVDPEAEIAALNGREKLLLRLGQWSDALALAEAGLLLKPDQEAVLVDAMVALAAICHRDWGSPDLDRKRRVMGYHRQGLRHLERFADLGAQPQTYDARGTFGFVMALINGAGGRVNPHGSPEDNALVMEAENYRQDVLRRLIPKAARAGWKSDEKLLQPVLAGLSLEKQFEIVLRLIEQVKDFPGTRERTLAYSREFGWLGHFAEHRERFEPYYDRLLAMPNAEVQAAAKKLKSDHTRMAADYRRQKMKDEMQNAADTKARAEFRPDTRIREVDFLWEDDATGQSGRFKSFAGCMAIDHGIDVIWNEGLYLMKQPGRLKRIRREPQMWRVDMVINGGGYRHICYDGKFIWAAFASHNGEPPHLVVADPISEECWQLTSEDGLPVVPKTKEFKGTQFVAIAPVSPGKICVAGHMGGTWLGIAETSGPKQKSVKVFHEAREVWRRTAHQEPTDTNLAFEPTYMFRQWAVASGGGRVPRIIVGRGGIDFGYPALLINPDLLSVGTLPPGVPFYGQWADSTTKTSVRDEGIYSVTPPKWRAPPAICRATLPRFEFKPLLENVPPGFIVTDGDLVHIISHEWWTGRLSESKLRCIAKAVPWWCAEGWSAPGRAPRPPRSDELPEIRRVFSSNHYGVLVQRGHSNLLRETTFEARELMADGAVKAAAEKQRATRETIE